MVDLAKKWVCSGNSWNKNPTTCSFTLDSQIIASQFNQQDLTINGLQHADGIHETPSFVPNND